MENCDDDDKSSSSGGSGGQLHKNSCSWAQKNLYVIVQINTFLNDSNKVDSF
jgi:hypothetical protein